MQLGSMFICNCNIALHVYILTYDARKPKHKIQDGCCCCFRIALSLK